MGNKINLLKKCITHLNKKTICEVGTYVKKNGVSGLKGYVASRASGAGEPYKVWYKEHAVSEEELARQREERFDRNPLISIVVPVYQTPLDFLKAMVDSVKEQSYGNWQLCIADGSGGNAEIEAALEAYAEDDPRVCYKILEQNEGISGNTNQALSLAKGDYIGLLDHDDVLALNALFEVVKELQVKDWDILYSDEDMLQGSQYCNPIFKPDFSPDLFRSHNYISHFFVVKKAIVDEVGGFDRSYDGSQDYDFMFRCIEKAKEIKHIPKILYHWRMHEKSVAGNPASKMYAYDAGKRAIEAHLKRQGIEADVEMTDLWGMYHVTYKVKGDPLLSIIIPNKDHTEDLDKCIESIFQKSSYTNFEILIVENNSILPETFTYYQKITEKYANVRVLYWEKGFNYAAINNYGTEAAKGEYILFLNNDTELISPNGLAEMLGCCMQQNVGAVGAKLLYGDGTVQHAGVVIGFGGYAGHVNTNIPRNDCGYMNRAVINCDYSAVTGACLMTKKDLFRQVGGFDERFVVACNDVDYCLKLREKDQWIVYNAFAEWYHYESKSRGYEDTPEKQKRFRGEVALFQKKWKNILEMGDPFYNPNFSLSLAPFKWGK